MPRLLLRFKDSVSEEGNFADWLIDPGDCDELAPTTSSSYAIDICINNAIE
jgi:hypothetical protein